MPNWSSLSTRTAGYKILASDWNAVIGNLNYLGSGVAGTGRAAVMATDTSTTAITTATWTLMTFASEEYDTNGSHSTVSNTGRLTVPAGEGGLYHVTATVVTDANATQKMGALRIRKNAAGSDASGTLITQSTSILSTNTIALVTCLQIDTHVRLSAADYLELFVWHDKGSNLDLKGTTIAHRFGMYWVSA
jgi:hypothetical protein